MHDSVVASHWRPAAHDPRGGPLATKQTALKLKESRANFGGMEQHGSSS